MSDGGSEKRATFLVTHATEDSTVIRDVHDGQVHPLSDTPCLSMYDVIEGVISPDSSGTTWSLETVERSRRIELVETDLEPTRQARKVAADLPVGKANVIERAGEGEIQVISVSDPADAAREVLEDCDTIARAARLGAARVEVRFGSGMISVRYLPN